MSRKIGIIGLGAMGFAMAKRLIERQYRVTGFDLRSEPLAALAACGGYTAESPADVAANADVLILMVVNADQVDDVLFRDGVAEVMQPGATVVSMVTSAPDRVQATAKRVANSGLQFVDAPVSGGVPGIEAGTLTIMAAAPDAVFADVAPLLRDIGSNTYHLGTAPGQGAAMKTVNQLLAGVHIAAAAEALALAEAEGINVATALEVLSNSAASSWMLRDRGARMIEPGPEVRSAIDIFVKDLGIVEDTGRSRRFGLPLASAALQLYLAASGSGLGKHDDSQLFAHYRRINGTGPKQGDA
ncbi:MAG: NAD(P)-dependent oxidoreductase [Pseudomonadota bacterium]